MAGPAGGLTLAAALVDHSFNFERTFNAGVEVTKEETQTRIVDAAFRTLVEHGYHDTTMKDIAGRAGLATGLAHYYFRSKDDLLIAALEHGCPLAQFDLEGLSGIDQARLGFAAEKQWQIWNRDAYTLIFDMVGAATHKPEINERLRSFLDDRRQLVTQISGAVLAGSDAPPSSSAKAIGAAIWGAFMGIALQRLLDPEFDGDAALDALEEMALIAAGYRAAHPTGPENQE